MRFSTPFYFPTPMASSDLWSGSTGFRTFWWAQKVGGVPTTPDPNTSAKAPRDKREAYRDTNWWCICYFLPTGGDALAKA